MKLKAPKIANCSQCAHGDTKRAADFKVGGTFNRRPYRANLCLEHHDMMLLDGADISIHAVLPNASASAVGFYAAKLWNNYKVFKQILGSASETTERAYRKYIVIADRAREMGLDY